MRWSVGLRKKKGESKRGRGNGIGGREERRTNSDVLVPNPDNGELIRRVLRSELGEMREDGSAWRTCREAGKGGRREKFGQQRNERSSPSLPSLLPSLFFRRQSRLIPSSIPTAHPSTSSPQRTEEGLTPSSPKLNQHDLRLHSSLDGPLLLIVSWKKLELGESVSDIELGFQERRAPVWLEGRSEGGVGHVGLWELLIVEGRREEAREDGKERMGRRVACFRTSEGDRW